MCQIKHTYVYWEGRPLNVSAQEWRKGRAGRRFRVAGVWRKRRCNNCDKVRSVWRQTVSQVSGLGTSGRRWVRSRPITLWPGTEVLEQPRPAKGCRCISQLQAKYGP